MSARSFDKLSGRTHLGLVAHQGGTKTRVALARRLDGRHCDWWDPKTEELHRGRCWDRRWFVVKGDLWNAHITRTLPKGRYFATTSEPILGIGLIRFTLR